MILKNESELGGRKYEVRSFLKFVIIKFHLILIPASLLFLLSFNNGCGIYKFNEATVPDSIKTVKIIQFLNRARYVNPQLSPRLTDKLRQKIVGQTRLSQTNNDNADWEISGTITDYSLSTSAISGQREATNRLSVSVHVIKDSHKEDKKEEYDVNRSFEFSASKSLQQAESELADEMIRALTDEIFNKLFSNW